MHVVLGSVKKGQKAFSRLSDWKPESRETISGTQRWGTGGSSNANDASRNISVGPWQTMYEAVRGAAMHGI